MNAAARKESNRPEEVRRVVVGDAEAPGPVRVLLEGEQLEWHPGESLVATLMAQYFGRRGRGAFMGCREGGCGACRLHLERGVVALRFNYS